MKLDRHGIRFNVWLFFFLFAIGVVALIGVLQFTLIKPYYRNNKIKTVQQVADRIQNYMIDSDGVSDAGISKAFQVTVDNNVCAVICNDQGTIVYNADSLGSGCIFHTPIRTNGTANSDLENGSYLKSLLQDSSEYSRTLMNSKTNQEMIVYGRTISGNLGNYYIFVNSPLEPVDSIVQFFSQQYIMYTFIVVVGASILSLWFSSMLCEPIVDMQKSADELAKADYSVQFEGGRFTETKELAGTLNDAKNKLSKIDELRKDLIANISHDIKTPLTNIKAYAEMIRDISGNNPAKREEHLDVIIKETDYLDHLVVDMSQLAKMQSGNYVLQLENFDIAQKIRDIVELNRVMIDESRLIVVQEIPESLTVYADEVKIGQVIYNFLSNAIKHTPQNKHIWIRAFHKDEETVRVEVQDEGEGISAEDLPNIWDRYQKIDKSFSRRLDSTGLGLAIVKAILDTHHAQFGVVSELGKGSTFWFEMRQENVVK